MWEVAKKSAPITLLIHISKKIHIPSMEKEQESSPSSPPPPTTIKTYTITASSISYTKFTTRSIAPSFFFKQCCSTTITSILHNVSLTAYPSQILAILGPSGAGKSTLLDILAARTSPTNGTLHLNSTPLNPCSFRKLSAYVPQDDAFLPLLTVSETFIFTATLLYPKTTTPTIATIVNSLLANLRLTHLAHTRLSHGLSGGERRRVSIGLSLLHDPAVLLLDEPTSGLDSNSAYNVMQTLKSIATTRHRTIILSIHQPSFKILSTIDRILLLSKGNVVHHGTLSSLQNLLQFNGFTIPPQLNSLEYAMEILHESADKLIPPPSDLLPLQPPTNSPITPPTLPVAAGRTELIRTKSSRIQEIITLYIRFWKIIYRTKQLLLTNTLQALVVGIVLGTIYINIQYDTTGPDKRLGLFAFTLTFLLSSTTETLPIFINERPILLRETSSGIYRLSSYLISNTLVFLPYLLTISTIYSISLYFLVGLCNTWQAFSNFLLIIWIIVLMANSFVLLISSITPNYIAGSSLVAILLAGFFLFSGYFISKDSMPRYWVFMHYLSMYKYGLDALLINEYSCLITRCLVWDDEEDGKKMCVVTGGDVLQKRGLHQGQRWSNVCVLVGFFVFYRLLCFLVLSRRVSKIK